MLVPDFDGPCFTFVMWILAARNVKTSSCIRMQVFTDVNILPPNTFVKWCVYKSSLIMSDDHFLKLETLRCGTLAYLLSMCLYMVKLIKIRFGTLLNCSKTKTENSTYNCVRLPRVLKT